MMNRKASPKHFVLRYALIWMLLPLLPAFNRPSRALPDATPQRIDPAAPLDGRPYGTLALPKVAQEETQGRSPGISPRGTSIDTIEPIKSDLILFYLIFDPNLSPNELEKLRNEKLPFGKTFELITNEKGKLTGSKIQNVTGGSCSSTFDAEDDLPVVIFGTENGCGNTTFNAEILDKMISKNWPKGTKVITAGITSDPKELEAYRSKILSTSIKKQRDHLSWLAENNWMEIAGTGSTSYRIPLTKQYVQTIKDQVQAYIDARKDFTVVLNGKTLNSTLPDLDTTQIKKMVVSEQTRNHYMKGTPIVERQEKIGLKLEIDTKQ
jgi:hypothetical protein